MAGAWKFLRDLIAVAVCAVYVFPLFWWGLSSITPNDALLDLRRSLTFDYSPTFDNYAVALMGAAGNVYDSRQSLIDSVIVAVTSTLIVLIVALPAAYAVSKLLPPARRRRWLALLVLQRFLPPIAIIFPFVLLYHTFGLLDSRAGLALAHAGLNLPFAILLLTSFLDDIPHEISEAAMLDGANHVQILMRVLLPMTRGGIAAAAIFSFILSWTEFLVSLFLTQNLRLMPVQAAILVMNMWGLVASLTTAALVPAFIFVLLVQRHLVRGLTLGFQK